MAKSFADQLHDFKIKVENRADDFVSLVVTKLAAEIDLRSPVGDPDLWVFNRGTKENPNYVNYSAYKDTDGYIGGHFRANWQLGVGTRPSEELPGVDKDGKATQAKIIAEIPDDASGRVFWLTNNVPYAQRLEHGWSTQAPSGMVGLAVVKFKDIAEVSIQEAKAKDAAAMP